MITPPSSHAAAAPQEAPPHSVNSLVAFVSAKRASLAGHVTNVLLVTTVTLHAQHVAVMPQEPRKHSAIRHRECVTVTTMESVNAR